jgi:hypothetical protein
VSDELLQLTARVELEAAPAKGGPPKLEIVAYTGGEIIPSGMGPTVIDTAGLKLAGQIPLVADHVTELASIVGHGTPTVEAGNVLVRGSLIDATPAASQVLQLARGGFEFQASVGVQIGDRQFVRAGETVSANGKSFTAGPRGLTLVKAGVLREVSILAIGADSQTSVAVAAKGEPMTTTTTTTDADTIRSEAIQAERQRLKKIEQLCAGDFGDQTAGVAQLRARAVAGDIDVEALAAGVVDALRAARPQPGDMHVFRPHVLRSSGGVTSDALCASLMLRAGGEAPALKAYGEQSVIAARKLGITSLVDLAAHALQLDGRCAGDYGSTDEMLRAAFSTVNLPNILANVTGRILMLAYQETTRTWSPFCFVAIAQNFKPQMGIRPAAIETLSPLGPTGEIKLGILQEEAVYNWQVGTYARMLGITRTDIINDDLGFVSALGPMLGVAAGRALNDLIWKTILGGQTANFFSAANGNLLTTATSALSSTSLGQAIAAMRKQMDSQGNSIQIAPQALVVPPELEMTAKALVNSALIGRTDGGPTGNALLNIVPDVVVESRLSNPNFTGNSATQWYLFGPPFSRPVTTGFLAGLVGPTVQLSQNEFNTLGIALRCFFDFGVSLSDPKAAVKAVGA